MIAGNRPVDHLGTAHTRQAGIRPELRTPTLTARHLPVEKGDWLRGRSSCRLRNPRFPRCLSLSSTGSYLLLMGVALCGARWAFGQTTDLPFYVGRGACLECHAEGHGERPCSLESIPEHLDSYKALDKPKAEHIAAVNGVPDEPTRSLICLGCHATGAEEGPRWATSTFNLRDGVQCEACHGPGSLHVDVYCSGRLALPDDIQGWIRRGDRADCTVCHMERRSHRLVLDEGYRVSPVNKRYRTPVNLAVAPDGAWLYVVCEHSDSLIVVDLESRRLVDEIAVGRRPHDVAVSPDGRRLYVTNRLSDTLTVIDAASREVVGNVAVGDGPHGVITDAAGRRIFVLNTGEDSISILDATTLAEQSRPRAGRGPWSLALRPDGETACVTNVRPNLVRFREPPRSELTVLDVRRGVVTGRPIVAEANMMEGVAFVPGRDVALFVLMRTKNLVPGTRLAQGWAITNGLGVLWPNGRVDQVLLDAPNDYFPDPTDVAVSPDGRYALVTSGGADQVAVVDVEQLLTTITEASDEDRELVLPNHLGIGSACVLRRIDVGSNPRGIVFAPSGQFAYVANALDDTVTILEAPDFNVVGEIDLGGPSEVTELRWGERLFHSANNAFGRQFACRSCHPDGHVNGLTHDIEADGVGLAPVDNRTLRGILDTAPFKWEGTNPSLERQCGPRLAVFFTRIHPFTPSELTALVRYMSTIERPPNRHRPMEGLTLAQRRGKVVFDRPLANDGSPLEPKQRCVHCHRSPYKNSATPTPLRNKMFFDAPAELHRFDIFDRREFGDLGMYYYLQTGAGPHSLDVPHLNNVYDSPPYLHNGAAETLEEIWTRFNLTGEHGMTDDLTRQQFNDLIAYLKAL